jgi:hypothetical protein
LDLSDDDGEIDSFLAQDRKEGVDISYFEELRNKGNVKAVNLSSSFTTEKYTTALVDGLVDLSKHEGPYLVHCVEGKDRTGFVMLVLEALGGCSYDEMRDDYMKTYENYYHLSYEKDPAKYDAIAAAKFDDMMTYLAGSDDRDLNQVDWSRTVSEYLYRGGMNEGQVAALTHAVKSS